MDTKVADLTLMKEELSHIHTQLGKQQLLTLMRYVATTVGMHVLKECGDGVRMNLCRLSADHLLLVYAKAMELKTCD